MPLEKFCKKCNTTKPASAFSVCKKTYKGKNYEYLQSACKPCITAHSKHYDENFRTTPKRKPYTHETWNEMKSPIPWGVLKGKSALITYKEYPTCLMGHRYVGPECLPCKYALIMRTDYEQQRHQ